jgi:hypothetical protein
VDREPCCKDSAPLVGSWLANLVSQPTGFNDIVRDPSKCWMKTHFVTQIRQDGSCFDFGSSFHTLDFCVTCILQVMYVMRLSTLSCRDACSLLVQIT